MLTKLATFDAFLDELSSITKEATAAGFKMWARRASPKQLSKAVSAIRQDLGRRAPLNTRDVMAGGAQRGKGGVKRFGVADAINPIRHNRGFDKNPVRPLLKEQGYESMAAASRAGVKSFKKGTTWPGSASHTLRDPSAPIRASAVPMGKLDSALDAAKVTARKRKISVT